jgi:hypothetical protein
MTGGAAMLAKDRERGRARAGAGRVVGSRVLLGCERERASTRGWAALLGRARGEKKESARAAVLFLLFQKCE